MIGHLSSENEAFAGDLYRWGGMSLTRSFQATYDDRFEQGLICPSSGKLRLYSASNQFSNQIDN